MSTFKKVIPVSLLAVWQSDAAFFYVNFKLNWELYVVWIINKCVIENVFHSNIQG